MHQFLGSTLNIRMASNVVGGGDLGLMFLQVTKREANGSPFSGRSNSLFVIDQSLIYRATTLRATLNTPIVSTT